MEGFSLEAISSFIEKQGFSVLVASYLLWSQDRKLNRLVSLVERMSGMFEVLSKQREGKE